MNPLPQSNAEDPPRRTQEQWHTAIVHARRWGLAEVAAAAVAIACYVNVLPNEFTDDGVHIAQHNPLVTQPGGWGEIWMTDYWADQRDVNPNRDLLYRPAAVSSYKMVRAIAGPKPWPQLLANILLHALVSVLTVRLCRHLGGGEPAAWAAGLAFAAMPIHVEVIANVVGRADMIAAAGVLIAALAHRRSRLASLRPISRGPRLVYQTRWRLVAAVAAFIAMAAKESGVAAIPVVVLMDLAVQLRHRDRLPQPRWIAPRTVGRLFFLIAPLAVYLALRIHALGGALHQNPALSKTVNVLVDAPPWQHWMGVVQLWGMYWQKTVWPGVLSINYSINTIQLARHVGDPRFLLGGLVTLGLIVWSVVAWRRGNKGVAIALAMVLACYAPTSNALLLIQVYFAERIWYLPSIGVAVLAGFGASRWMRHRTGVLVGALVVLAMCGRCWVRNVEWHDNGTVYASAYRVHPDAIGARLLYGGWLTENGRYEEGVELLNRATDIDFGFTDVHRSLGRAHLAADQYDLALHHLQIADMQIPGNPSTVVALGQAREMVYRQRRAQVEALRLRADDHPEDMEAEIALLRELRDIDRRDEALQRLRGRESAFGGRLAWEREYIDTLVYAALPDEAIRRYEAVIAANPNGASLMAELAALLMERSEADDLERAWALIEEATKLAPGSLGVLICRADLLRLRGALDEAATLLKRIIASMPPEHPAQPLLAEKLRILGG